MSYLRKLPIHYYLLLLLLLLKFFPIGFCYFQPKKFKSQPPLHLFLNHMKTSNHLTFPFSLTSLSISPFQSLLAFRTKVPHSRQAIFNFNPEFLPDTLPMALRQNTSLCSSSMEAACTVVKNLTAPPLTMSMILGRLCLYV